MALNFVFQLIAAQAKRLDPIVDSFLSLTPSHPIQQKTQEASNPQSVVWDRLAVSKTLSEDL